MVANGDEWEISPAANGDKFCAEGARGKKFWNKIFMSFQKNVNIFVQKLSFWMKIFSKVCYKFWGVQKHIKLEIWTTYPLL